MDEHTSSRKFHHSPGLPINDRVTKSDSGNWVMRSCETDSIGHELNLRWVGVAVSNNIIRLGNVYQGSCWFFFSYQSRLAQLVHHLLVSLAMMDRHHQPPPPSPWKQAGTELLRPPPGTDVSTRRAEAAP